MVLSLRAALVLSFALSQGAARQTAVPTMPQASQNSVTQQWRELADAKSFFRVMSLLESLGQDSHERAAVLNRLHEMWTTYDVLRRPEIAYLMCQLGDQTRVEDVAEAFFAGDYYYEREIPPDHDTAGSNAVDAAFRVLILYGTPEHHRKLLAFLQLRDDPLAKGSDLCRILLELSSVEEGPGLPASYPKEQFPLELVIACLDYTKEVATIVVAPGGSAESHMQRDRDSATLSVTVHGAVGVYEQRGCDYAAQTIQNLTSRDFGYRVRDPVSQRDKAVDAIKKWWSESHTATRRTGIRPD
ncbi:MAG TPA: hypothetical protein VMD77_05885 [Candidatus Baltobacteraceae bacterium]|nr:hypothetical protein [Candidatus Baltobacteraceae bacterium]